MRLVIEIKKVYTFDELSDNAKEKALIDNISSMDTFWQELVAEYDYHTSLEYFREICEVNDCEFLENGELY